MNYAYVRVSTVKQDERRQEMKFGGYKINIKFIDKASGKNSDRPELNKLMLRAKKGDNIYIESISRLGRNVDDLRKLCKFFEDKGVIVHFIKEGFNTKGDMYKFLLTILGAVAEMERELIVGRVKEGINKAKKYGTKSGKPIGRPKREDTIPKDFKKYYIKWVSSEITAIEFAKLMSTSRATLYRYIKTFEVINQ